MIVTVCYGRVRVVVPCGDGSLKVDELKELANERYNKAIGRPRESHVPVHHLLTQSGILDPDDELATVVSDKEQIFVCFDDDPRVPQGGGDGASGSSAGTGSPDIFRGPPDVKYQGGGGSGIGGVPNGPLLSSTPHIEVTSSSGITASAASNAITIGGCDGSGASVSGSGLSMLQVRRSSDPSLNINANGGVPQPMPQDATKRWSAAAVCRSDQLLLLGSEVPGSGAGGSSNGTNNRHQHLSPSWEDELEHGVYPGAAGHLHLHHHHNDPDSQPDSLAPSQFSRSGRLSMQFLGQDAIGGGSGAQSGYKWMDAAERAQQAYNSKSLPRDAKRKEPLGQAYESIREKNDEMLLIVNETGGALGLTAVPDPDNGGLLVQNVAEGGRAERGRLRRGDRILEINGTKLVGLSEQSVQEHLRRCCAAPELRVRVIRATTMVRRLQRELGEAAATQEAKGVPISPSKSTGKPASQATNQAAALQAANTRKIGRKIVIALRKGPHGLGFSVTTRDNPAGGQCPIYIKTILPRGAAIVDGRLKPGDRLLEVDGVSMTGRTQSDVVQILRAPPPEATVEIVVSRQQEAGGGSSAATAEVGVGEQREETEVAGPRPALSHFNDQLTEADTATPPKPPAPIFPHKSALKSSARKTTPQQELTEQNVRRHFIEAGSESVSSTDSAPRKRETLTLHIPINDTEKAGLGVSVKGKTGSNNSSNGSNTSASLRAPHDGDLGIFVKSVLNGGAASLDGRLRMNDQLLYVNEISLLDQSNEEAMETLRKAMLQRSGTYPGTITLVVSRRIGARPQSQVLQEGANVSAGSGSAGGVSVNGSFSVSHTRSVSSTSEQSGKTVIYLSAEKLEDQQMYGGGSVGKAAMSGGGGVASNRWNNPVLDRLTGGTNANLHTPSQSPGNMKAATNGPPPKHQKPTQAALQQQREYALRNESYYMATNETWSPGAMLLMPGGSGGGGHMNTSVLIEEDPEPPSPTTIAMPARNGPSTSASTSAQPKHNTSTTSIGTAHSTTGGGGGHNPDATYDSQLSLDTNPDAFSRDAIGRRSMSEKHHAALDAKETGTYQRNKKAREQREQREHERRVAHFKRGISGGPTAANLSGNSGNTLGSMESLTSSGPAAAAASAAAAAAAAAMAHEALDCVGDLGPSLGLKKSSSLESLQTMVQEIQMADEPGARGPMALRTPRGRGREAEALRAAVESRPEGNKPRKHWLLEDGPSDTEGGFISRHGPFQSSLNEGKHKQLAAASAATTTAGSAATSAAARTKKPGLLRGIGHMFRFGKHRKDGIAPAETYSDLGPAMHQHSAKQQQQQMAAQNHNQQQQQQHHLPPPASGGQPIYQTRSAALIGEHRPPGGPPNYQPPPPVAAMSTTTTMTPGDTTFNQRYAQSLYVNHGELQQQLGHPHHHHHQQQQHLSQLHQQQQQHQPPLSPPPPPQMQAPLPPIPTTASTTTSPTSPNAAAIQQQQQQAHLPPQHLQHMQPQSPNPSSHSSHSGSDLLSESTIAQMRQQVMHQRVKVEEESRRNQHYHSQRSVSSRKIDYHMGPQLPAATLQQLQQHHQQQQQHQQHQQHHLMSRTLHHHHQQQQQQQPHPHLAQNGHAARPVSQYYGEYETVHKYGGAAGSGGGGGGGGGGARKSSAPTSPLKLNGSLGSSGRYQMHAPATQQQRL